MGSPASRSPARPRQRSAGDPRRAAPWQGGGQHREQRLIQSTEKGRARQGGNSHGRKSSCAALLRPSHRKGARRRAPCCCRGTPGRKMASWGGAPCVPEEREAGERKGHRPPWLVARGKEARVAGLRKGRRRHGRRVRSCCWTPVRGGKRGACTFLRDGEAELGDAACARKKEQGRRVWNLRQGEKG